MNQRQSSSHVKSWIFVWLVCKSEVQFSQHFIDFPINHDHSDGKKQGQRIFIKGLLSPPIAHFSATACTRLDTEHIVYSLPCFSLPSVLMGFSDCEFNSA